MNDSESRSGESARASVEAERKRLREQLEEIREKYGPGQAPTDEEMRTLSDEVREFVDSNPPELLWPEGVEPPADGLLFGILRTPGEGHGYMLAHNRWFSRQREEAKAKKEVKDAE